MPTLLKFDSQKWICVMASLILGVGVLPACSAPAKENGQQAAAEQGHLTANGPVGMFFMTRYNSSLHSLEKAAWYFQADGTAYENIATGLSADELKAHKGRTGTYKFANNKMTITWNDRSVSQSDVERDGKNPGFMWDMGIFTPAEPITKADMIVGSYDGGETLTQLGPDNAVFTGHSFEFRADGTYTRSSIASVNSAVDEGTATGKWQADGYTMSLTDGKGKTIHKIAFPVRVDDAASKPDHLYFGGLLLKRKGK